MKGPAIPLPAPALAVVPVRRRDGERHHERGRGAVGHSGGAGQGEEPGLGLLAHAGLFPQRARSGRALVAERSNEKIDFARAKVSVRTADGKALEVRRHKPIAHGRPNYGSPALVWQVTGFALPTGTRSRRLDVTVSGIRVWNQADTALTKKKITKKYSVRYFDADVA